MGVVFFAHGRSFHRFDQITKHLPGFDLSPLQSPYGDFKLVRPFAGPRGDDQLSGIAVKVARASLSCP